MLLEKFAPRQNARTGYEHLIGQMDGAPKDGLFAAKIGFHTEMLLDAPPTLLLKSQRHQWKMSLEAKDDLNHFLFRTSKLSNRRRYFRLLSSENGDAIISVIVLPQNEEGGNNKNAGNDEMWYVHKGSGVCHTMLGGMTYRAGDFIFIPKFFYFNLIAREDTVLVGIESRSPLRKPARKNGDNADTVYNDLSVSIPDPNLRYKEKSEESMIREIRGGKPYTITYANSPRCVAYRSTLYPFIVNVSQLNFSYTTSIHADPTNFCLFGTADDSVMISVLGPRFVHSIPYNHLNEWDEFLFYAKAYSARAGLIEAGDATLHPQGLWHGPQIPALMSWQKPECPVWTDELAIMFESRETLLLCEEARGLLIPDYEKSWLQGWKKYNKKE